MAYNPFAVFRRNQKTLFAILTIIIMIVFTLSFGAGDFFQWLPTLLGKSGAKGDPVAKVDGSKVYEPDLAQLNQRRFLASEFMVASIDLAARKFDGYIKDSIANASRENKQKFIAFTSARSNSYLDPQSMQMLQQFPQFAQQILPGAFRQGVNQFRGLLGPLLADKNAIKEDQDLAQAALNLMDLDQRRLTTGAGYFQHKVEGDDTQKGAFDFDLWLQKADKLGIRYSEKDAQTMYLDEFYGQADGKALAEMEQALFANKTGYSRDMIFKALADEFRVRTTQNVVLGRGNAPQVFPTPWEAYQFYRKTCEGGTYAVISVPAENFVGKVAGMPSESEMRKLFDTYRNKEADPAKDNLGLREPRKLKLGWLEVKGDEPYYKKLGAEALATGEVHARAALAALVPLPGGGFDLLAAPVLFNLKDPALSGEYANYKDKHATDLNLAWFPSMFLTDSVNRAGPLDASMLKPASIAATAGVAAGSLGSFAGPIPMALLFAEKARINDRAARAAAFASLFAVPTTGGSMLLGPSLAAAAHFPTPLPLAVVRNELMDKVKADAARLAAQRDLQNFSTELAKLGVKPDKTEARAYVAKFIGERGLASGESKSFDSQWTMVNDEGLKPLIDRQIKSQGFSDAPLQFGRSFFFENDFINRREVPATTLYAPQPFPNAGAVEVRADEPTAMVWRTEEQPAETPKDFEKAKPKIVALWKRIESRKLAEAAAKQIADDARAMAKADGLDTRVEDQNTTPIVDRIVSEVFLKSLSQYSTLDDKARVDRFQIEDVAPLSLPQTPFATQSPQPRQFQLTPRKALPYPTPAMQAELLANKDGKPATTIVMNEDSRDRFYVAILLHRQVRGIEEFYSQVYNQVGSLSSEVRGLLQAEQAREAFRDALALLKAEFKVEIFNEKLK